MKWPFRKTKPQPTEALSLPLSDGKAGLSWRVETLEQVRYLLARIQQDQPLPRRLALTAALSGDGVTFTSYALAASIAHDLDRHTCIVDLNWHRPYPSPLLAAREKVKTLPVEGLNASLYPSGWSNLWLLHFGSVAPAQRAALARSRRLAEVLDGLEKRFDALVLDLPAVLLTSDSVPLAALADGIGLVVRQGATPAQDAQAALAALRSKPVFGTVINRAKFATPRLLLSYLGGRG